MFAEMDTFWAISNKFELFGQIWTGWTTLENFEKKIGNVFKITEKPI